MIDKEINEAVARKLGWKECQCEPQFRDEHRRYMPSKHNMPDYCGSIEAAWEIVEFTKTESRMIEITGPMGDVHWVCRIYQDGNHLCGAGADTAPMAICLVFLKLP